MSTYLLVPASIQNLGSPAWTQFGGTVAGGSLADGSDSSGIAWTTGGYSGALADVRMVAPVIPAGEVVSRWRATCRARTTVAGVGGAAGTVNPRVGQMTGTNLNMPLVGMLGVGVFTTAPDGPPRGLNVGWFAPSRLLSAAEAADCFVRVQIAGNGGFACEIAELRLELVTTSVPSAPTVSGPSGTVSATTRPTITWTHNDADSKAQSGAVVALYTAAQYSAAGFDPDPTVGSAPVFTATVGADTSATPGLDLTNSTTYRAYVRTASLTAGGAEVRSVWGFSQFTMSLIVPTAPSSLSVSRDPGGDCTTIVVASAAGAPVGTWTGSRVLIERSIDGVTWSRVLVRPGTCADADGAYGITWTAGVGTTVRDYECPRGGMVTYRARQVWIGPSGAFTSLPATQAVFVPLAAWHLVPIGATALTLALPLMSLDSYGEQVDSQTETYNPPGGGVYVIRRPWAAKQSTAQTLTETAAERAALLLLLAQGTLLVQSMIVEADGFARQWYASVVGTVAANPVTSDTWQVSWSMLEVEAPGVSGL